MSIDALRFLKEHSPGKSTYAIVKYAGKEVPVFFANYHSMDYGEGFIEEPCYLHKIYYGNDLEKFCKHYAENMIGPYNPKGEESYIKTRILPYIRDNTFLLIETPSVEPFLPEEIDEIILISDQECIDFLLKQNNI